MDGGPWRQGGEIFGPQSLPCARAGPWVGGDQAHCIVALIQL